MYDDDEYRSTWAEELVARDKYLHNKAVQVHYEWYLKGFMVGGCT
jgi:hypothetical protein